MASTLVLAAVPSHAGASRCPNESLRIGLSASLPDCRAYEMVSPPEKAANPVFPAEEGLAPAVASNGGRALAQSFGIFAGTESANFGLTPPEYSFIATPSSWQTVPLNPSASQLPDAAIKTSSPDTGATIWFQPTGGDRGYWLETGTGSISEIGPEVPAETSSVGIGSAPLVSHDLSHVVFEGEAKFPFDQTLPAKHHLYEYVGTGNAAPEMVGVTGGSGSTTLIGQCGAWVGGKYTNHDQPPGGYGTEFNAISETGEAVFFTVGHGGEYEAPYEHSTCAEGGLTGTAPKTSELYARLHGSETVWVSEPSCVPASACANAVTAAYTGAAQADRARVVFEGASADGTKVFFATTQQLTTSDTDLTPDLYEYDFNRPAGERLRQVSAGGSGDATPGAGAEVRGVSRISEDGSHVYFVARGVLTTTPNGLGQTAKSGAYNLYVSEPDPNAAGSWKTAFVALLCTGGGSSGTVTDAQCPSGLKTSDIRLWDSPSGESEDLNRPVQTTPDGKYFVFLTGAKLTPDDTSATGAAQVFRYAAENGQLTRISVGNEGFNHNGNSNPAATAIVATNYTVGPITGSFNRTMSDDGSYVFFESPAALTPTALDDVEIARFAGRQVYAENVYEWHEGRVSLISDGNDLLTQDSSGRSAVQLIGTDESGANVFFATSDPLVPQDVDTQVDFYDAHVGGGFPPPAGVRPPCEGDSCHGPASEAPTVPGAGTATFVSQGNPPRRRRHRRHRHHRHRNAAKGRGVR